MKILSRLLQDKGCAHLISPVDENCMGLHFFKSLGD